MSAKTEKIGNICLNLSFYGGKDLYSDGSTEDELLEIVKEHGEDEYESIINDRYSWPLFYHLSPYRGNVIEWIDFSGSVLEVGAGCGAVTGVIADKADRTVCIELSKKRSTINAYRHKNRKGIEIYVGNFEDVSKGFDEKFDFATLIGVLEYGGLYISSSEPCRDFLSAIKKLLKPGGRVVIAIENKIGMKYWAGCSEDHTGRYFDSVENYPSGGGIRTFSRRELKDILTEAGFGNLSFYYPYPDYKFASVIYSDGCLPKKGELNNNMRNFDRERLVLFDEKKAFDTIIDADLFAEFSNSFLVIGEAL